MKKSIKWLKTPAVSCFVVCHRLLKEAEPIEQQTKRQPGITYLPSKPRDSLFVYYGRICLTINPEGCCLCLQPL